MSIKNKIKNIEPFCGNCELNISQRCFKIYGKENDSPCENWKLQNTVIYHSKVLKTSYKQRRRLFVKHLRVRCNSYLDYWGEASGCNYDMGKINEEMGAECGKCCVVRDNHGNLKGKFNPELDKIIK